MKAVIVLGNKLKTEKIHKELKRRVDKGVKVFRDINADYLILSGGFTTSPSFSEAEVMQKYAIEKKHVKPEKILLEQISKDTIGNAYFTRKKIIDEKKYDLTPIYIVSSCYHMKRTKFIFKNVYGNDCKLKFKCSFICSLKAKKEEKKKMKQAKKFFKGIQCGDMEEVGKRLFSSPLYRDLKDGLS